MYVLATGSWQESLVDGWSATQGTPEGYYHWESTLAGGFWDVYSYYDVSGFVEGVGDISGNVDVYYLFQISGDITGVGYIFSDVHVPEPIRIDGYCYGVGKIGSKFNFSRRRSLYPSLRQDVSYAYNDTPIAAIEYIDFSPNKIINIVSYEDSKFENTPDFYLVETIEGSGTFFPSRHYPYSTISLGKIDYLVTDIKAGNENSNPLFYQYELLYDVYSTEDGKVITLYKNNEVVVNASEYIVQCSYDIQGSGHERYSDTTWIPFDNSKKIHRLRILLPISTANKDDFFTVKYDKSVYGARSAQRELLELTPLYQQGNDFIVTSGVQLTSNTKIKNKSKVLYLVKDPDDRIKPIGVEPPVYQPDQITQWRLRLNPGSLLTRSGLYNNEPERFYSLTNKYAETYENRYVAITNVKPIRISENIIQVAQYPIFIDETLYKFPTYQIDVYDKTNLSLTSDPGKVAIEVNGVSRSNIKILSIDRKKGYLQLSETLNPTDEIELDFYVDPDYHIVLENLELNPKISTTQALYKISDFPRGLGVAVRELSADPNSEYVYLYDSSLPASSRTYYMVPEIGGTAITVTNGSFFSICELDLNRMSTDMVKVTDARRVGGGIVDEKLLDKWFVENSGLTIRNKDSYVGKAFYGGDPTSFASAVVIHVPSGVIYSARDRWIASLSGVVNDPIEAKDRGTREFNFYLDQVIKRYISAGTDYMLIPIDSSGNFMNIMNLTYDYSV